MPCDLFASFSELLNIVSGLCLGALLALRLRAPNSGQQRPEDGQSGGVGGFCAGGFSIGIYS
jgi:hypothetical protein